MRVYVGIGSNLGDRQANILAALQRLRKHASVLQVSSFYESVAAGGAEGPPFLNVAAEIETELSRPQFEHLVRRIETAVGRAGVRKLAARPIDIDLLVADAYVHPQLSARPYNAVPLAEIAPNLSGPMNANGIVRRTRSLRFHADRQDEVPDVRLSLGRAGVTRVRRIIRASIDGRERPLNAEFTMVADLAPGKAGVHMSRFHELLEEVLLDVLASEPAVGGIDALVETIAARIIASQRALRADVRLRAEFALERWTPVSAKRGEETYTLLAIAGATARRTKIALGIEAEGMTACPCAQGLIREDNVHELTAAGFSAADVERVLDVLPAATHNQRGRGSVTIGLSEGASSTVRLEDLVEIVETAMSSETYDLLKRPDEFFVVKKAHSNPKFAEDVVRGILLNALEMYGDLGDDAFVAASQVNYESIHKHDAFAEAAGTFGEFRDELRTGEHRPAKTDLTRWLES